MRKIITKKRFTAFLAVLLLISTNFLACTKYYGNGGVDTNSGSGNGNLDPLPPYWGGGSGSGSGGSGSSGSGGTGGSGSGGGTGTVDPNIPKSYVQSFIFTGASNAYLTINDSLSLKLDGSYTEVYAGQSALKYKIGNGAASDPVYTFGSYFLRPYNFYTYVVFKSPQFESAETIIHNDLTVNNTATSQVRFISLDPLTSTVPVTYRFRNSIDDIWVSNRTYLDNKTDSSFQKFRAVTPGQSTVSFYYRDSSLLSFNNIFDVGKKYTVFSGAAGYVTSNRGQIPIPVYFITRHN